MINKIRQSFALTENGARGVLKASLTSFLLFFSSMLPIFVLMYYAQGIIEGNMKSKGFFIGVSLAILAIIYVIMSKNYDSLYNATYSESKDLRVDIAETLKSLPLSYYSKYDISDISQVVMSDIERIEHALSHAIPQSIGFSVFFIIISAMLLGGNLKLGLAVFIPIALSFVLIILSKKFQIKVSTQYYEQLRRNSESFQEAIEMQADLKSYSMMENTRDELYDQMEESEKIHIKTEFQQVIPIAISFILLRLAIGVVIVVGSYMYIKGEVNLLYLLGYILAASKIVDGMEGLFENLAEIMYLDSRVKRIKEIRNTPIQEGKKMDIKNFDIQLKDVEFSYSEDAKVIDGLSFTAKQGEVTAIVGPSGCGKTTVLRLISRLYDVDKGKILVDNVDVRDIDTDSLFEKISIVFQDVILFNNSVMENIRIGRPDATDEEVRQAAKMAQCEDFIEKLPKKYDTMIGENGSKLSGGERQRISIARAFLKDSPIIILDEISSSLDVENEMKIQETLNKLIEGKTVVIISHRLKSVEKVDKIVVMDKGKVDSIGSHKKLLKKSKLYRKMIDKSKAIEGFEY